MHQYVYNPMNNAELGKTYLEPGHDVKMLFHVCAEHHACVSLTKLHEGFRAQ